MIVSLGELCFILLYLESRGCSDGLLQLLIRPQQSSQGSSTATSSQGGSSTPGQGHMKRACNDTISNQMLRV